MKKFTEVFLRFDPGFLLFCIFGLNIFVFAQADIKTLEIGQNFEGELAGEQKQFYKINLPANRYFRIVVEQIGVDVTVSLTAADGKQLAEIDSPNGREGLEELKAAFENAGEYRLEITANEKGAPVGRYKVNFAELREANAADIKLFRADHNYNEGIKLRSQRSVPALRQAIEKFTEAAKLAGEIGEKRPQAISTSEKALTHQLLGEYDIAIEIYNQAIAIAHEGEDYKTEGTAISNIGFIYNRIADYQKALYYFHRSLEVYKDKPDLEAYRILPLANIAVIYKMFGEFEKTVEYYNLALELARKHNRANSESTILLHLGVTYSEMGNHQKGLETHFQVLPFWKNNKDRQGEVNALGYIADDYFYLNDYQNASDYFNQQLKLGESSSNKDGMGRALFGLGKISNHLGNYPKALDYLNKSLNYFNYDKKTTSTILLWIAQTERKNGQLADAENHFQKAIELIESVRNRIAAQELRTAFFSRSNREIYEAYISLLMEMHKQQPNKGYDKKAFAMNEKAKARSLLELLAVSRTDIRQGIAAELLERENKSRTKLNEKAAQLSRLLMTKTDEEKITNAKNEYEKAETELQEIEAEIRKTSPRYAALLQAETISTEEVQANLLDKDTALIEYSLGENGSFLWVVTNNAVESFEIPKREEIEKASRNVYQLLTARNIIVKFETDEEKNTRIVKAETEMPNALKVLSKMILLPAVKNLRKKRLLIVPDGALHYIPFAVLPLTDAQPLISQYEIVNLPSASTLASLRKDSANRPPQPKEVAIFADPVFDKDDERYKFAAAKTNQSVKNSSNLTAKNRGVELADFGELFRAAKETEGQTAEINFPRLPFTRKEADSIAALSNAKKSLDFSANRASVVASELSQYRIIHFATHSFISTSYPELSGIVLSLVNENGQDEDGFIRPNDIYNMNLPADLVILSGCKTGLGKEIRGEGLVGMTRAFMYAGTQRLAVSLWDVNDEATAELMTEFYRAMLKEKRSPAESLRLAQISMLKNKRWKNPYYWAAFTLQGEPR